MILIRMIIDNYILFRFANAVEDGTSCGGSGLQLCLAGVCEVCLSYLILVAIGCLCL